MFDWHQLFSWAAYIEHSKNILNRIDPGNTESKWLEKILELFMGAS